MKYGTRQSKNLKFPNSGVSSLFLPEWRVSALCYWGFIILMARKRQKLSSFVPLIWTILNSSAYKDLSPSAAKALPYFLGKGRTKRGLVEFEFPYSEAYKRYGFPYQTFARIIKDLIKKGKIV